MPSISKMAGRSVGNHWEFEGEQGMEESGVRFFSRLWWLVGWPQQVAASEELCLCLPEFASVFAISLTFIHTCISYGGNALGGGWFV